MPLTRVVAEPADLPARRAGPRGEALHRVLSEASQRADRELALRLVRTGEHASVPPPAARPD